MEEKEVITSGNQKETINEKELEEKKQEGTELSYNDLKNAVSALGQENNSLKRKINELINQLDQMGGAQTRLHFLFKILENKFAFDSDYIIETADEIKSIMTIREPENTEEEK